MAFNLQKVLKALLFSSSQPLAIKDIQAAFARFHEQAVLPLAPARDTDAPAPSQSSTEVNSGADTSAGQDSSASADAQAVESPATEPEPAVTEPESVELYLDVPSLVTATQIREAMEALAAAIREENGVFLLVEGPTGYRLVTHPRYARWIRILRDEPPPVKLTQSALETLAIIAYRQPVTRTEIETIRGVSAEAGLGKLLERDMIYVVGRADLPGRPLQYGTTDRFLDFVGVKSLVELPSSDVLSPRQIDEWLKSAINPKPLTDAEMGLPLEEGEGSSPNRESVAIEHAVPGPAELPDIEAPDEGGRGSVMEITPTPLAEAPKDDQKNSHSA
ncbi:MAG: SMC-Scp complex subunit ScpB [Opitutaceae bacterium]|nr:SMC-Scp complex subunit ScpB [Opitutaceae bacterium]